MYYVDESGVIKDTDTPPAGTYFSFEQHRDYLAVLLINSYDGEVLGEYVGWHNRKILEDSLV